MSKLKDKTTPPPVVAATVPVVNVGDRVNYVTRESEGGAIVPADVTAVGDNGLISVRTVAKEPVTADNVPYYPAAALAEKKRTNTWHLAAAE